MASTKEYLNYILSCLPGDGFRFRAMMGEYIMYYSDKVVGGIYDNRLLVKPTKEIAALFAEPVYELPYDGAKPMLRIFNPEDTELIHNLIEVWNKGSK